MGTPSESSIVAIVCRRSWDVVGDDPGGFVGSAFALHREQFAGGLGDERVAGLDGRAPQQVDDESGVP